MAGVLYHPHFEPSLAWLRSALLLYDSVWSIVPREANYEPSDAIKRHLESLPESFAPLAPHPIDIEHEYFVLRTLGLAFRRIASQPRVGALEGVKIRCDDNESDFGPTLELLGMSKIHDGKVAYTIKQMLEEAGLVYGASDDGFSLVNADAAYLIISFLAQRMSTRLPLRTITDLDPCFLLSASCNVIESGDPVDSKGMLASAILRFHVPEEIGELDSHDYLEIRKRYEELRQSFPLYLRDLGELISVDDIRHAGELKARIESLVTGIDKDLQKIKRSRLGGSIRKWLPLGLGAAVTLGSAFLPDNQTLRIETAAAGVALSVLSGILDEKPIPGRLSGAQSLLLDAKKDILSAHDMASSLDLRRVLI